MESRRSSEMFGHLATLFQVGAVGGLSDTELLEQFVSGHDDGREAAFRALVARHGPMVLRVCRSVLNDPDDSEDAFQVTFLALARKAGSIRRHGSIASWLHGTAVRVARKARTAARRRLNRESRVAEAGQVSESQSSAEYRELSPLLHAEIERLPAKYRAPIVLCYLEGMTHDQAADELGWPVGTVRGRLARARDLLRSRLARLERALTAGFAASGSLADWPSAGPSPALVAATIRAALGTSISAGLSATAVLLLKAVLRDMALARWTLLGMPVVLTALIGGAAVLFFPGGTNLFGERTFITKPRPVPRPVATDVAGDPLPDGALARLGTTRFLHGSHVSHIAYSPDGKTMASLAGALYLWSPLTGRELRYIETGIAQAFAYAPDGQSLAIQVLEPSDTLAPGKPRRISPVTRLYDLNSGRGISRFEEEGTANSLAFSPDGKVLAEGISYGPKTGITLREAATGRVLRSMGSSFAGTTVLAFSPDGKALISCVSWTPPDPVGDASRPAQPAESLIGLWEVATGKEIRLIRIGKARIIRSVLAPDGHTLATGAADKTIRLWDLATGREIRRFGRGDEEPFGIAFSPDGTKLVSTAAIGPDFPAPGESLPLTAPLHVWDTATGRELRHWATDNNSLACFSPDGMTLVSVGGQLIRLWEAASGREIQPQTGHCSGIEDASFTPDSQSVVTLGRDRTVRFWDSATAKELRRFEAGDIGIRFAALAADGKILATGGGFQPTRLWELASGRELRQFQTPGEVNNSFVECADLAPDGKTLAAAVSDSVVFWDTATGERRAGAAVSPIGRSTIKALRFAPDGKSVATIHGDWVRIWNTGTSRETRRFSLPNEGPNNGFSTIGAKLVFSPDGTIVAATSTRDGLVFLIEVASGRELARLEGCENQFKALAFSPDGKTLATGVDISRGLPSRVLAIRFWDLTTHRELVRFKAHRGNITALAFSPDGKRLLSASEDATALVWDVARLLGAGRVPANNRESLTQQD